MINNFKIKKYILLIFLVLITFLVVVVINRNKKETQKATPTPKPIEFKFNKAIPQGGDVNIFETSSIEFYFTRPVSKELTKVSVSPDIKYEISTNSQFNSLYIRPLPEWDIKTEYTIDIEAISLDGTKMSDKINYKFKIEPIKDSLLTE